MLWGNIAIFVLICGFVFSPLRLNTDSIRLFAMALPAATGGAYGTDQFPPLYPHLLCSLMKIGWCNSYVLLSINIIALFVTLCMLYKILKLNGCSFFETMLVLLSVQLCWCVAKHMVLPQTDILLLPFFFGCILAIMYAERTDTLKARVAWLVAATLGAVLAMTVRIAAIPLFAVIAVVATGITPQTIFTTLRKRSFWICAASLFCLMVGGVLLAIRYTEFDAEGGYFRMFKRFVFHGGIGLFVSVEWTHLREVMQLSVNMSVARLPSILSIVGTILMPVMLIAAIVKEAKWLDWALLLVLMGYGAEIFLWPCTDARFMLPIFPIASMLVVHFLIQACKWRKWIMYAVFCYMTVFALLGVSSWGWLARQWGFGKEFYRHTAEPLLSRDFKNAYYLPVKQIPEDELTLPLFILKKFDCSHTFKESEELDLTSYQKFNAKYSRD